MISCMIFAEPALPAEGVKYVFVGGKLAFADGARELSFRDALGRSGRDVFNRYDFLTYDASCGGFYYDTDYLFSCEKNDAPELARDMLWQKNLENLRAGTLGDPTSPVTLLRYWRSQEQARYPFARENVEYFEELARNEQREMTTLIDEALQRARDVSDGNRVNEGEARASEAREAGVNEGEARASEAREAGEAE